MFYYPDRWNDEHGDDHLLSFCALTAGQGRLVFQSCFTHARPSAISRNAKGWRDARRGAEGRSPTRNSRGIGAPPPANCTAGKYLAFHYVRPEQQLPLYERGGSPW